MVALCASGCPEFAKILKNNWVSCRKRDEKMGVSAEFFDWLKSKVPSNVNLAAEMGQLFSISLDSAYRRLSGKVDLTLDEAHALVRHFSLSLVEFDDRQRNYVQFQYQVIGSDLASFYAFISGFVAQVKGISRFENRRIFYAAEDIPLFHIYALPRLTAFKFFYWRKTILSDESLTQMRFHCPPEPDELVNLAKQSSADYALIESTEVWTEETISSTLKQIQFYWEAGLFQAKEDALLVLEDLKQMLWNIQRQCDLGLKIGPNGTLTQTRFDLYISDLMIGNNCVYVEMNEKRTSFLGYNTFHFMNTGSESFNQRNQIWMENLISKSTLVSRTAEKLRNQFFKKLNQKTEEIRRQIELD